VSAERTSRAAVAAEQLCAALWEALHERLRAGDAAQAAALGERIAEVSRTVSALACAERESGSADSEADAPRSHLGGAILVDERQRRGTSIDERRPADAPIAIRDARGGSETVPWSAAVQRRLDRYRDDRERFAVLVVELLDAERLRVAQPPSESERQLREVEAAIVEQLRPADALVREVDGRYWLIAPHSDAEDARAIAGRLAAAARRSASHRGAPLGIAVGIALCPEHGIDAGALTGHAEVDLYAAQAAGRLLGDPDDSDPAA
jgi:GGDEF domain-containing protein